MRADRRGLQQQGPGAVMFAVGLKGRVFDNDGYDDGRRDCDFQVHLHPSSQSYTAVSMAARRVLHRRREFCFISAVLMYNIIMYIKIIILKTRRPVIILVSRKRLSLNKSYFYYNNMHALRYDKLKNCTQ